MAQIIYIKEGKKPSYGPAGALVNEGLNVLESSIAWAIKKVLPRQMTLKVDAKTADALLYSLDILHHQAEFYRLDANRKVVVADLYKRMKKAHQQLQDA